MQKKFFLLFLPLLFGKIFAQTPYADFPLVKVFDFVGNEKNEFGFYTKLKLDMEKLSQVNAQKNAQLRLEIPINSKESIHLLLTQVELLDDNFKLNLKGSNTSLKNGYKKGIYYRGYILNQPRSLAAISFFDGQIIGVFSNEKGNWNIANLEGNKHTVEDYVVYCDKELVFPIEFSCSLKGQTPSVAKSDKVYTPDTTANDYCVPIVFHCDNALYKLKKSNIELTANYITGLFNVVSTIYQNDEINVKLAEINIWTEEDPFFNNQTETLYLFHDYIRRHSKDFIADTVYHLLSKRTTTPLGGLAFLGDSSICQNMSFSLCSNSNAGGNFNDFPIYSFQTFVVAHEIGHNLSSPHTHWCDWVGGAIDNCAAICGSQESSECILNAPTPINGGTIMSYCHLCSGISVNFINGFGAQPKAKILQFLQKGKDCLVSCCQENQVITTPFTPNLASPFQMQKVEVNNSIVANNIIEAQTYIKYDVGKSISFLPGFWAKPNAQFHAYIDGCGGKDDYTSSNLILPNIKIEDFKLYPNPATKEVRCAFSLLEAENISIEVIDVTGRFVAKPIDDQTYQAGRHIVALNTQTWASGIYFVTFLLKTQKRILKLCINPN